MNGEVKQLVDAVEDQRMTLLANASLVSEAEGVIRPAEHAWSVAEIVEHLYLAELGGIAKIWAALESFKTGKQWDGPLPHHSKRIDHVVAETWKPKEIAPPVATPHIGGPLGCWLVMLRSLTPVLVELGRSLDDHPLEKIVFPHYLSGPLDARQRLEFLGFHMDRHLAQIEQTVRTVRASDTGVR